MTSVFRKNDPCQGHNSISLGVNHPWQILIHLNQILLSDFPWLSTKKKKKKKKRENRENRDFTQIKEVRYRKSEVCPKEEGFKVCRTEALFRPVFARPGRCVRFRTHLDCWQKPYTSQQTTCRVFTHGRSSSIALTPLVRSFATLSGKF